MPEPQVFGRRQTKAGPAVAARRPTAPIAERAPLDSDAEALRSRLAAAAARPTSPFAAWRRSRQGRETWTWVLGLAFLSPGLICMAIGAPSAVSIGLELAGFGVNAWLRGERRRRAREITAWEEPAEDAPYVGGGAGTIAARDG
jgi:hypothetical protein